MGWSGKSAGGIAKAGESVGEGAAGAAAAGGGGIAKAAQPGLARTAAVGGAAAAAAGAGAIAAAKAGLQIPKPGSLFEFTFTSVGERTNTPEARAIRAKYFPPGQTAAEKGEASNRLVNDALNREREWRNSAIEAQHPDWTEQQVAEEWVRYWLGDNAARRFTFRPG